MFFQPVVSAVELSFAIWPGSRSSRILSSLTVKTRDRMFRKAAMASRTNGKTIEVEGMNLTVQRMANTTSWNISSVYCILYCFKSFHNLLVPESRWTYVPGWLECIATTDSCADTCKVINFAGVLICIITNAVTYILGTKNRNILSTNCTPLREYIPISRNMA